MFEGAAALNLDAKGRLAIPTRHREGLAADSAATLVLTAHPHRCLLVYPLKAWEPIRDKLVAAPSLETQSALLKRLLLGHAENVALDAAGRVLVSPELRDYAGLGKEVWLVGQGHYFELWSDAGWKRQKEAAIALGDQLLPPGMETLVL
jgi:MraZ protein